MAINIHTTEDDVLHAIPEEIATGTMSSVLQQRFDDFDFILNTMPTDPLLTFVTWLFSKYFTLDFTSLIILKNTHATHQ